MTSSQWWRWRALEFTVAVAIVASTLFVIDAFQQFQRAGVPAANWFVVNEIYVPDHRRGENPTLTYDRQIKEPFLGFWVVEVERMAEDGKFTLECSGSGVNDYQVTDYIPRNAVTWSWFTGDKCESIPAGRYRIRASWRLKRPDWPDKEVIAYSNPFTVEP